MSVTHRSPWRGVQQWLGGVPFQNAVERQQAPLLQIVFAVLCGAGVVSTLFGVTTDASLGLRALQISTNLLGALFIVGAWVILRRGFFRPAIQLAVVGVLFALTTGLVFGSLEGGGSILLPFLLPLLVAGLLAGRRELVATLAASVLIVVSALVLAGQGVLPTGSLQFTPALAGRLVGAFVLTVTTAALMLDQFGGTLRTSLIETLRREQELTEVRTRMEEALDLSAQREAQLTSALDELQHSEALIRELSAPIIPVLPGVLITPLIGALDSERILGIRAALLEALFTTRARRVILDITGVPGIDATAAAALLDTTAALRLMGAQAVLVGISAEVAQTMAALGISLAGLPTYANLQAAILAELASV